MLNLNRLRPSTNEGYLAWVLVVVIVTFSLLTNQFLTLQNLLDLSESYAVSGIFALGLFVVLVTGGIDISFAAVASVVQYTIATLAIHYGLASPTGTILLDRHRLNLRHDQRHSDLLPAHRVDHRHHQHAVAAVRHADVADQRHQSV